MENNPDFNFRSDIKVDPQSGSIIKFANPKGKDFISKFQQFSDWQEERDKLGHWPFGKMHKGQYSLDYSLFDYMGLSKHPKLIEAAHKTISEYGISSSGSPCLNGRTELSRKLELKTKSILNKETCLLYPTGWAACFGAITGIVSSYDTILIDRLAHNCLATAAKSATKNIKKFKHNDLDDLEKKLTTTREKDKENAIVIVLESLYSMNSTAPNLDRVMKLAEQFDALVIIDIAHELGCYDENGLGILNSVDTSNHRLVIAGSYSKVFGTNGGFVAGHRLLKNHFIAYSPTYTFSSAIAPMQCGILLKGMEIAFSEEGKKMREKVMKLSLYIRAKLKEKGFQVDGKPSAIIPIIIGAEYKSRAMFPKLLEKGVLVNLIEFPVVKRGRSLFRLMLSPDNTYEELDQTVDILKDIRDNIDKCENNNKTQITTKKTVSQDCNKITLNIEINFDPNSNLTQSEQITKAFDLAEERVSNAIL